MCFRDVLWQKFPFFYVQIHGTVYLSLLSNCYVLKSVTSQLSVHADKSVPFLLFAGCFSSQFYHNGGSSWHSAMRSVASPIQFRESVFLFQFRCSNQFRYFQIVGSFSFLVLGLYQHWSFRCLFSWFCQFRFEVRSVSRACCYVSQMRVWCFSSTSRAKRWIEFSSLWNVFVQLQ